MKIINVPIEPLDARYSTQWQNWFGEYFNANNIDYLDIVGKSTSGEIKQGAFLDIAETLAYKASQMQKILELIPMLPKNEKIVVFFHDIWFPGIESLFYLRDGLGLHNLKICGTLHSGSYDKYDHQNKIMERWATGMEKSWFDEVDAVFVATSYHANLLSQWRGLTAKIHIVNFPIFPQDETDVEMLWETKDNLVVFPHRIVPEKQYDVFLDVARAIEERGIVQNVQFEASQSIPRSKAEYFDFLKKGKIAVSTALAENWGIAMQEAVFAGCIPLVPNRLSYRELYLPEFIYQDEKELIEKIETYLQHPPFHALRVQRSLLAGAGEGSIAQIVNKMTDL